MANKWSVMVVSMAMLALSTVGCDNQEPPRTGDYPAERTAPAPVYDRRPANPGADQWRERAEAAARQREEEAAQRQVELEYQRKVEQIRREQAEWERQKREMDSHPQPW
jgi:hypothetical protein